MAVVPEDLPWTAVYQQTRRWLAAQVEALAQDMQQVTGGTVEGFCRS